MPKTNLKLILPFKVDLSPDHDKSIKVFYKKSWSLQNDISLSLNRSTAFSLFTQNGSSEDTSHTRIEDESTDKEKAFLEFKSRLEIDTLVE